MDIIPLEWDRVMIVHAMSSYDLCSLDMMFYGYESMFMIYIYIVLWKTSLRTIVSRKGHLRQMIILQSCVYESYVYMSYVYEKCDYKSVIYTEVSFSV
jgi:hypothetical protein